MNLNFLRNIEPRPLYMAMIATTLLTVLAAHLYLFKKPLRTYKTLRTSRQFLQNKVSYGNDLPGDIETLRQEVHELDEQVRGKHLKLPVNQIIAKTINTLDRVSAENSIRLQSIKPESVREVNLFEEIPFRIELSGEYSNIYQWLYQVESQLGPMAVKSFDLTSSPGSDGVTQKMSLTMVVFRPL